MSQQQDWWDSLTPDEREDVMTRGDIETEMDRVAASQEGEDLSDEVETINVEPNWEGLRQYVLTMFRTDPTTAYRIAADMGCEAPIFPAACTGVMDESDPHGSYFLHNGDTCPIHES